MVCDYYVQNELVIEYADRYGVFHKTTTNAAIKKHYIMTIPDDDSDDDIETQLYKYNKEIEKCIKKHTYNKMLYDNSCWVKESYKKRYNKELSHLCPNLYKMFKVYKTHNAWEHI